MFGDIAFWASKGQYRMPTREEIKTLWVSCDGCAAGQHGYVMDGSHPVNGILFTSTASWMESGLNSTSREFTAADLESGLFLPFCGRGFTNTANYKNKVNSQGLYWVGTFGDMDAKHIHCPTAFYITWDKVNCSIYYGTDEEYDEAGNVTTESSGSAIAYASVRPVLVD